MGIESPDPTYSDDSARSLNSRKSSSHQKPSGIRPNPKAAVSARPEMSMKAKAIIAAMFTVTVITPLPLQRCLEHESGEKLCPTSQQRLRVKWNYSRPTRGQAQITNRALSF